MRLVGSLVVGGVASISTRSSGIRPAFTNGLRVGGEQNTPLLFCESRGETTGEGETALTSELLAVAPAVDEAESGKADELLELPDAGFECRVLLLSPWMGVCERDDVVLCSVLDSPQAADDKILAFWMESGWIDKFHTSQILLWCWWWKMRVQKEHESPLKTLLVIMNNG